MWSTEGRQACLSHRRLYWLAASWGCGPEPLPFLQSHLLCREGTSSSHPEPQGPLGWSGLISLEVTSGPSSSDPGVLRGFSGVLAVPGLPRKHSAQAQLLTQAGPWADLHTRASGPSATHQVGWSLCGWWLGLMCVPCRKGAELLVLQPGAQHA